MKGGEIGMTDYQGLTLMIAFGTFVASIIFGTLTILVAILNLTKKK
jgi:hypothetical protein